MTRATLSELDGLSLRDLERLPDWVQLARFSERGFFRIDGEICRLTPSGHERARVCCATCTAWKPIADTCAGECWSTDRLDGERSKGPADVTYGDDVCVAHPLAIRAVGGCDLVRPMSDESSQP